MGWNELSDPDMRTANFEFSCDVYREGVYGRLPASFSVPVSKPVASMNVMYVRAGVCLL